MGTIYLFLGFLGDPFNKETSDLLIQMSDINNNLIEVSGLDILDGTPIIDIRNKVG
jgi:hypothetical protein